MSWFVKQTANEAGCETGVTHEVTSTRQLETDNKKQTRQDHDIGYIFKMAFFVIHAVRKIRVLCGLSLAPLSKTSFKLPFLVLHQWLLKNRNIMTNDIILQWSSYSRVCYALVVSNIGLLSNFTHKHKPFKRTLWIIFDKLVLVHTTGSECFNEYECVAVPGCVICIRRIGKGGSVVSG